VDLQLTGRRALVTGASRGIGRGIADLLATEGCSLAICARGLPDLEKAAAQLRERGATVYAAPVDVSVPAAVTAFVERAAEELGGLDIVVSNASAGNVKGPAAWEASFRAELLAFVTLTEAAVPHLERSDQAAIVAIGTTNAADTAYPAGPNPYSAMKAAVVRQASALAHAVAGRGIRVNTVSPGPVEFAGGAWHDIRSRRPDVHRDVLGRIPVRRFGTPEEVAAAVAFLASPMASFCVGVNLVVDGGLLSRVQF
jgi:3-oxoacyl-[acyl-carrier protein] reductase